MAARQLRQLRFLGGAIADASSDVPGERLGDVLVRHGLLSQADLDGAVEVVLRERKRLGPVLAEKGLLDDARIREGIGLHVRRWSSPRSTPPGSRSRSRSCRRTRSRPTSSARCRPQLILDASRRVGLEHVSRAIAVDGKSLVAAKDDPARARKVTLTPADGFILSRIDGTLRPADLASVIPLPREEFERSLFGLLSVGLVAFVEAKAPASPRARREPAPASDASSPVSTPADGSPTAGPGAGGFGWNPPPSPAATPPAAALPAKAPVTPPDGPPAAAAPAPGARRSCAGASSKRTAASSARTTKCSASARTRARADCAPPTRA